MAEGLLERDPMERLHELYNDSYGSDSYGNDSYDEIPYGDVTEETQMSEDAEHNAHIRENYENLINPDKNNTFFQDQLVEEYVGEPYEATEPDFTPSEDAAESVGRREFKLIEGARASSYIFHAESPVNEQFMNDSIIKTPLESDLSGDIREERIVGMEEESEDLRPSATTIQYIDGVHSEDAVREKVRTGFFASLTESKKRRLLLGGLCAVLFALVVVVIVNCAVISHLSKSLEAAQAEDQTIEAAGQAYETEENVYEIYE